MAWHVKLALVVAMVPVMECVARATHRYVMHGWGWWWHRSHHEPHDDLVEGNDLYALSFAAFVVVLFVAGLRWEPLWWVALSVSFGFLFVRSPARLKRALAERVRP